MSQEQTKKKIGVVVMCLTPEKKEEIEATFRAKYGSEYEIKVMSPEEFKASEYPQAVFIDEVPAMNYPIYNHYDMTGYIPRDVPSKKAQRTSPYAKFDKFHRKNKKKR